MLRKLSAVCCLGVLSFVLAGCADSATTVDPVVDTPTEAVDTTDTADTPVDGAVDHAEETAKDGAEGAPDGK